MTRMPPLDAKPLPPRALHFDETIIRGGADKLPCCILDHHLHAVLTHWWDGRTEPCYRNAPPCPICDAGGKATVSWEGYLSIVVIGSGKVTWTRISPHQAEVCPDLTDVRNDLRGAWLEIWRKGEGMRGKKFATVKLGRVKTDGLAEPIPWERFLAQQWEAANKIRSDVPPDRESEIPH